MSDYKLTQEQEQRFDEARLYLYDPSGSHLSEKAVKRHLAQEIQRAVEETLDVAVEFAEKNMMNKPVGSPPHLVLNRNQYRNFLTEALTKTETTEESE